MSAKAFNRFKNVLSAYPDGYTFEKNIYYDCVARPVKHFKAFFELAHLFPRIGLKPFNCFPLRRSFSPCYIHIDTVILCQNILKREFKDKKHMDEYWDEAVDLNSEPLKKQMGGKLKFLGSIETDGVGVTVIKEIEEGRGARSAAKKAAKESMRYITELSEEERKAIKDKCVAVDPGRRDLLFCVHEKSTVKKPIKYRYTKSCQNKTQKRKEYRQIRDDCKEGNKAVQDAERALSRTRSRTLSAKDYEGYLKCRSKHSDVLTSFYRDTLTIHPAARSTADTTIQPTFQPLFRKLRLSAYIKKQQSDHKLIQELTEKFKKDAVFVMGDWSAPHAKYHEPTRGIGFRRLLQRHFKVFLIDEYMTSKCCPSCNEPTLETFKWVRNPRPGQRKRYSNVIRHGLLRCTNQTCKEAMKNIKAEKDKEDKKNKKAKRIWKEGEFEHRLWNRDMAACLNFIQIIRSHRADGRIPTQFQRGAVPSKRSKRGGQGQRGSKQQKTN
ncbi:hypothetical protein BDF22DRAFT_617894 [Syncephalis plumigaleata]|nr:hypothetical protein BDF22DRAFT_617894 [Syncephalis plumigaleata]